MKINHCHLRILTASTEQSIEMRIREKLDSILQECTYTASPMQSYWKFDGWGEIEVDVQDMRDVAAVKSRLAVTWDGDAADRRWTEFFDVAVMFLWLGEEDN